MDDDDCPDPRGLIPWIRAQDCEAGAYLHAEFGADYCEDAALFWYLTFYALVSGDL